MQNRDNDLTLLSEATIAIQWDILVTSSCIAIVLNMGILVVSSCRLVQCQQESIHNGNEIDHNYHVT